MGDNIPSEVQQEIIKRIDDVKTIIRCTSVSKTLNSFIKSPEFIADYHILQQKHHLLVDCLKNYVSVVDDDTFPQNKLSLPLPDRVEPFSMTGSSLGLFCFTMYGNKGVGKPIAVVWNPSIRKSITVNFSSYSKNYNTLIGFGVSPHTNDPMLVKITYSRFLNYNGYDSSSEDDDLWLETIKAIPVEVYTLSSRVWRTLSITLPRKAISLEHAGQGQVVVDEFIYWIAYDKILLGDTFVDGRRLLLSFDMKTEEFIEICLPKKLAGNSNSDFCLSKLRESLVVVASNSYPVTYDVWRMERGAPNSFEKLYNFNITNAMIQPCLLVQLRFRNSGGHIIDTGDKLFVYEPDSKDIYDIGFHGNFYYTDTYMETLLLLNQ